MKRSQTPHGRDRHILLLYHFCRLQLPDINLSSTSYQQHLERMFEVFRSKENASNWPQYLQAVYPLDSFLCVACLERDSKAWEHLFAARAGRADRLLIDALRLRAVRLFPRDEERQENAVSDFWGHLLVAPAAGARPILARYDGQRPLVPWLIRIFQNRQISQLRSKEGRAEALVEDDLLEEQSLPTEPDVRWHDRFCAAAREWLNDLSENDLLLLGLRLRYRMSQRDVAALLGVHEGTISRQITQLRDHCLELVGGKLVAEGWTGDDLSALVHNEMAALLMDDPRLFADNLARILAGKGKKLPA